MENLKINSLSKINTNTKIKNEKSYFNEFNKAMKTSVNNTKSYNSDLKNHSNINNQTENIRNKDIEEKLKEKTSKGKKEIDIDKIVLLLMNNQIDNSKLQSLLKEALEGEVSSSLDEVLNNNNLNLQDLLSMMDNINQKLSKAIDEKFSYLKGKLSEDDMKNVMKKFQDFVKKLMKDKLNDSTKNKKEILAKLEQKFQDTLKDLNSNNFTEKVEEKDIPKVLSNKNLESNSNNETNLGNNKEEVVLKDIVSDGKKDKISKATNFMTHFRNMNTDNTTENVKTQEVVVNKNTFNSDIVKAVKYMENNEIKDLTVKVVPRELGEIVIKLTMEQGVLKANLTAAKKETYNLIHSNLQDIVEKLQAQNTEIKVQNLSVNINNGYSDSNFNGNFAENFGSNSNQRQSSNGSVGIASEDNIDAIEEKEINSDLNNLNILA